MKNLLIYLILSSLVGLSCACAKKTITPPVPKETGAMQEIADIRNFPQNLEIYAKEAGASKRLLSAESQEQLNRNFDNIFFGPWEMKRTSIGKRVFSAALQRPGGYTTEGARWSEGQFSPIRNNANIGDFPNRSIPAITLRQTDLREAPTHAVKFDIPSANIKEYPFDYFQYSLLPPGMPVFIAHTSLDGKWHYIECPIAGGWVDARDVASVDQNFIRQWRTGTYAALIKENVNLPGTGCNNSDSRGGIGTVLPYIGSGPKGTLKVLVPVKNSVGMAETAEILLTNSQAAIKPEILTPGNAARIGNQMLGQPYGWGGTLGQRDCSAMIRDLFTPFGIWLPRNSGPQSRKGKVISLAGLSVSEKENMILRDGTPFLSLVGLPGHITLYVGQWKNRPALFHNAWGLRIIRNGNDDERFIIGRAVVTSITPGMELPDLYRPRTFTDRIKSLNTPGR